MLCFAAAVPLVARGESSGVSITGGADLSGKNYSWVVTNKHRTAIVSVEFPHYRGSLFFAPDGWDIACTRLVNVGVADEPGSCRATVEIANRGILPGQSQTFRLGMDARRARRGRGNVRVRFADATEVWVIDVEVPQAEDRSEKYLPLIGLAPILVVVVLVRRRRDRLKAAASPG